jgi:hypothetical protein
MLSDLAEAVKQPAAKPESIRVRDLEAQGATVTWNETDRSVRINKGDNTVRLTVGSDVIAINGVKFRAGEKISIVDGRTVVSRDMLYSLLEIDAK